MDATPELTVHAPIEGLPLHVTRGVIYVPVKNDIVVATPKVGNTSIRNAVGHKAQVPSDKVHLYQRAICFIRDPLERLESAFHYFSERESFPSAWVGKESRMRQYKPQSIEAFIDLILDSHWFDKHWYPQAALWAVSEPEVHPFEHLQQVMAGLGVSIGHLNRTKTPKEGVSYRKPELDELYGVDLALRPR